MASGITKLSQNRGGFDFENVRRNEMLARAGIKSPTVKTTGTTIVGIVFKDGIVLGADTRATEGPIVADKNCEKIHKISEKIWCCGAGTAADTENITGLISSQLELHRLATGREPRVATALTRLKQRLFRYQGYISAALVLGGVDHNGFHLHTVYPHGSTDSLPFATMGSGSLAAMAVFERGYKEDLDRKEAINLVDEAIQSGIFNDLGSGSNVDITIITKEGVEILRGYKTDLNKKLYTRQFGGTFPRGTTEWIQESRQIFKSAITVTKVDTDSKMEVL